MNLLISNIRTILVYIKRVKKFAKSVTVPKKCNSKVIVCHVKSRVKTINIHKTLVIQTFRPQHALPQ